MSKPTDAEMAENVLICEKLLNWKREEHSGRVWWNPPPINGAFNNSMFGVPAFTTWSEAGLILDALVNKGMTFDLYVDGQWSICFYGKWKPALRAEESGPLAIRAAALTYIQAKI